MINELLSKGTKMLKEVDTGSEACQRYNEAFMDGVYFILKETGLLYLELTFHLKNKNLIFEKQIDNNEFKIEDLPPHVQKTDEIKIEDGYLRVYRIELESLEQRYHRIMANEDLRQAEERITILYDLIKQKYNE